VDFARLTYEHGVRVQFIEPGKPIQSAKSRVSMRGLREECLNEHVFVSTMCGSRSKSGASQYNWERLLIQTWATRVTAMSTSVPANRNEKRIHHPHLLLAVQAGGRRLLGLPFLIPIMAPLLKRGGQWHSAPGP